MAKNGHVHEGGKVGRSNETPVTFFSVNCYDLMSMSFKFCNDIFFYWFRNAKVKLPEAHW